MSTIEATARDITPSVELERLPTREVLMPLDTQQVVAGMQAYQQLLPQLLDASDYQDAGQGRRFVKKSGWRKIARAFNLSVELISSHVERDASGQPIRAEVVARAIAPNGQTQDGDGYCAASEPRFTTGQGKQKLENDLRATATTRAKNRAIADLVGMGEVSAEEVAAQPAATAAPATVEASRPLAQSTRDALNFLLTDTDLADQVLARLTSDGDGKLPMLAARAVIHAVSAYKASLTSRDEEGAD